MLIGDCSINRSFVGTLPVMYQQGNIGNITGKFQTLYMYI